MTVNGVMINADCETVVSELKRQLSVNHINYLQIIRDSGNDLMVQCPYHGNGQERKPSAGIRKSDGLLHCFACNETHSLPEVISYCFGKNDIVGTWGMKWLVKNFRSVEVDEREDVKIDMERKHSTNKNNILHGDFHRKRIDYISEEELDSYRYYHPYWAERGIIDDRVIEMFDLGYDKVTRCITMPVRDVEGNCLFVARRSVDSKWFNYPKDVEKPLYGLYELTPKLRKYSEELFITESMIDALLLWQVGRFAVALNGTGNELQFRQLMQLSIRKYILATDNDKVGMDARERIKDNVKGKLFTEIIFPDDIKDIGDLGKAKRFGEIAAIDLWEVF